MRTISIASKIVSILAACGTFSLGIIAYEGYRSSQVSSDYNSMIDGEQQASLSLARANRSLQQSRGAIASLLITEDDETNKKLEAEIASMRKKYEKFMSDAVSAMPQEVVFGELKSAGINLLDIECHDAITIGSAATTPYDNYKAQASFMKSCQPAFEQISAKFSQVADRIVASAEQRGEYLLVNTEKTGNITMALALVGTLVSMLGGFFAVRRWIGRPVKKLSAVMEKMASGDLDVTVVGADRNDELGGMAKAVEVFQVNGVRARELESEAEETRISTEKERQAVAERDRMHAEEMKEATDGLADALQHIAEGDLSYRINQPFASDFEALRGNFNTAVEQLASAMTAVATATAQIDSGSQEMSSAAADLSKRTEQQAASLEETAAALEQITVNVKNASQRSEEARLVASEANVSAKKSGDVVAKAVDAMHRIEQSSSQISNIIGVIDEIAFQTNLLALNAGVEAARAGDAGRGFAVVAQEVRELAQRSAKAAKEIKSLIQASTTEVDNGVKLVKDTGEALKAIEGHVVTINSQLEAIAISSREQANGLAEVNMAVNQMDQFTQQNAAMVEQSNAASASLASEAVRLQGLIGQFKIRNGKQDQTNYTKPRYATNDDIPAFSPARRMVSKVSKAIGSPMMAGNWEEF